MDPASPKGPHTASVELTVLDIGLPSGCPKKGSRMEIPMDGWIDTPPPKFNIAPEKWWLEDEFPFGIAYFLGAMLNFRGVL